MEAPRGEVTSVRPHGMLPFSSVCHGKFLPISTYYKVPWDILFWPIYQLYKVCTMRCFLSLKTNVALLV